MPRSAAELRAGAVASGWFTGPIHEYHGDGYSIPWDWVLPVSLWGSGLIYVWKYQLDTTAGEAAHLHDWLYTPYGLIFLACTQEEADLALREEMLALGVGPVETEVIYQACNLGGAPWFGVSTTGYVQPPLPGSGGNITSVPGAIGGGPVSAFKMVTIFQQTTTGDYALPTIGYTTVPRTAGWSESQYVANASRAEAIAIMKGPRAGGFQPILPRRAGVLNSNARILGFRLYEVGGGRGEFVPASYPGTSTPCDQPSVSLLCKSWSDASPSVRQFTLRGIPDDQVKFGEFAPSTVFSGNLEAYFATLTGTYINGQQPVSRYGILKITAAGILTSEEPMPFGIGDIVTIQSTVDSTGRRRTGRFVVSALGPMAGQLTLQDWSAGACKKGKIFQPVREFFLIYNGRTAAVRSSNHKVGRPFAGYRGRSSRAALPA